MKRLAGFVLFLGMSATVQGACSSDDATAPAKVVTDGGVVVANCSADLAPIETRNVSCAVTLGTPALQQPASQHLPEGTSIAYCTNPPTSGPHFPIWADFKEYTKPIETLDMPYFVHSEEHGGVLLLYKCDPDCPDIVDILRGVRDRAAVDQTCETQSRPGVKRIIISPSTLIPTRVAAAAWGAYYTADCADAATLDDFVLNKGKRGPEDLCFEGTSLP